MTMKIAGALGRNWSCRAVGFTAAFLLTVSLPCAGAAPGSRPVASAALAGQVAPNTGGQLFTFFDEPMVNASGQVAFLGNYAGGAGLFLKTNGPLSSVVVSGDTIPGLGTVTFASDSDIDGPAINNSGTVAFVVQGTNTQGVIQKKAAGSLTVLAKAGQAAPGTAGVFAAPASNNVFDDISQNNNDDVAFIATYTDDAGVTYKTGVWLASGGTIVKIIAHGDAVPAGVVTCPNGFVSSGNSGDIDGPWMNDLKVVVFLIDGPCGNDSSLGDHLLVKQPAQPLAAFVTEGDPAPASIGGTMGGFKLGRPALNNSNTLAYRAVEIVGGSVTEAVVTHILGGSPVSCVNINANAPGTIGTLSGFVDTPPTINQTGTLAFAAAVLGDPNVSRGIFTCQSGTLKAIAFAGDPIPGTATVFSNSIGEVSSGDGGLVAFLDDNSSPQGVFVSLLSQTATPVPTLSEWATISLAFLLAVLTGWRLRRQKARPSEYDC